MNNAIPAAPGIYKITCTANKKIYLGSTVNLRHRRNQHFHELRHNKHCNPHLQNAWNKYGEQAFVFEVLEQVLPMDPTHREQYWFKKLKLFGKNGFNIAREAGSRLGTKHSPETRIKISQLLIGNKRCLGRKVSSETREKMRQTRRRKREQVSA